jgi:hypothetical protein
MLYEKSLARNHGMNFFTKYNEKSSWFSAPADINWIVCGAGNDILP